MINVKSSDIFTCPHCQELVRFHELIPQHDKDLLNKYRELEEYYREQIPKEREDAIKRSKEVIDGKIFENMLPYFKTFPYHPNDCRFLGSPIDLTIFSGLTANDICEEIILGEVKKDGTHLTKREASVRKCVEDGKVRYEIFQGNKLKS